MLVLKVSPLANGAIKNTAKKPSVLSNLGKNLQKYLMILVIASGLGCGDPFVSEELAP